MRHLILLLCLAFTGSAFGSECDSIPGAGEALQPGTVVLLGEIHGTDQGPSTLERLVCTALDQGLDITVGLEIPIVEQERVSAYLSSKGTDDDRAELISGNFWQRDYQDGRASRAMRNLIVNLRDFATNTKGDLQVVLIDNPGASEGRDHFMASRLSSAISESPEALVVSLTGNIHSQLDRGNHFDADYKPMGYKLVGMNPKSRIISLDMEHSGGSAWVCAAGYECGVMGLVGYGEGDVNRIDLYDDGNPTVLSGSFYVGEISASRPARE